MLKNPAPITILTGAGISQESGLATFRDKDGIWAKVRLEDVATPEAYARNPEAVQAFYNHRRRGLLEPEIKPNAAHDALARLEEAWPEPVVLVTQNIDDLHERAGSKTILHMHGELLKARCTVCGSVTERHQDITLDEICTSCSSEGSLRPHIVWFGEIPFFMEEIEGHLSQCGLFVSIGTSGNVYPAAGFVSAARTMGGIHTVELNLEPSEGVSQFHEARFGKATDIVSAFVDELLIQFDRA